MSEWLSVREYAALFHVHRHTVEKWRADGLLTIIRINKTIRVRNEPPRNAEIEKHVSRPKSPDLSRF